METETYTPLKDVTVICGICGEEADAQSLNEDKARFFTPNGQIARFPKNGLSAGQINRLPSFNLLCELCYSDS